jgi:hypothetical protein
VRLDGVAQVSRRRSGQDGRIPHQEAREGRISERLVKVQGKPGNRVDLRVRRDDARVVGGDDLGAERRVIG